jgi:uncharacterized protein (DUF3084 family)
MFPTYGVVFIAVLIIASGVIAYLGDLVGRKMGRRRLTLWGLRPRYTAMVMSIAAGMMITLVTLAAAMTTSDKVRVGLTQMDRVRGELSSLRQQSEDSRHEADVARAQQRQATREYAKVTQEIGRVRDQFAQAAGQLEKANAALGGARRELAASRQALGAVEQRLTQSNQALVENRQQLGRAQQALDGAQAELDERHKEIENAKRELDNAFDIATRTWKEARDAERDRDQAVRERDAAAAERDAAADEAARWKILGTKALTTRAKRAIFAPDEPIMTTSLDGRQSVSEIRAHLDEFVAAVDERARQAGAAGTDTDPSSVIIFRFERNPATGEARPAAPDDVLDALARDIHDAGEDTLVQAYSVWTGLEGEQTPIDFRLYRNRLVFHAGDEIARATFNSQDDQVNHLLQLVSLLQQRVGARAREQGVMPVAARWLPGQAVITSPPTAVGDVSLSEVKRVLAEIKGQRGQVEVVVRAARDTYTAGPLEISLAVEPGA